MNSRNTVVLVGITLFFISLFASIPWTPANSGLLMLLTASYILTAVFLMGFHYIVPHVIRSYRLGIVYIVDRKYIFTSRTGSQGLKVGHLVLKLIPTQSILDMEDRQRNALLHLISALSSGINYEVAIVYINVRSRYLEDVRREIERKIMKTLRRVGAGGKPSVQYTMLDRILRALSTQETLYRGLFVAVLREYGTSEEEVKRRLDASAKALKSQLSTLGIEAVELEGGECISAIDWLMFGSAREETVI